MQYHYVLPGASSCLVDRDNIMAPVTAPLSAPLQHTQEAHSAMKASEWEPAEQLDGMEQPGNARWYTSDTVEGRRVLAKN